MHFSEPLTDLRCRLYTDDGQGIVVDFNARASVWRLKAGHGLSQAIVGSLVRYLHDQFYRGDRARLESWLQVVERSGDERPLLLVLTAPERPPKQRRPVTGANDLAETGPVPLRRPPPYDPAPT
jgi:hypothetical protein